MTGHPEGGDSLGAMPKTPRGWDRAASDDDGPTPLPIPSFASLRSPGRRSGVDDVLVPGRAPTRRVGPAGDRAVRPAEYRDLVLIALRLARRAAGIPERLLPGPLGAPWRRLRRLLDDPS